MLYPIWTLSRSIIDLDGIWDFKLDNGKGFEEKWYAEPLEDAIKMPVPSSYNDLKEGQNFREHYGWVFYQKEFIVPSYSREQRKVLRCDAVTHHAKVYLNGEWIASNHCGFLPFEIDITDKIQSGKNLLTIAVSNIIDYTTLPIGVKAANEMYVSNNPNRKKRPKNNPGFDFFNYCGITRSVRIYTTPSSYIRDITLHSDIDGKNASVAYQVDAAGEGECHVSLYDKEGMLVAEADGCNGTLEVPDVILWQPLKAYLYRVEVNFGKDHYELPYGIRTVKVDGTRFLINGKPFYFKGYGKHEDTYPNGRGLNMPMNIKDISLMKWQGANSFRTSHYPYSEEMMRLCDEEGIVVVDETTAVGLNLKWDPGTNGEYSTYDKERGIQTREHHAQVIRDLITRDKNHACVVMWSIANEPDSTGEGAHEYFAPLFALAKKLDPDKRPCTMPLVQEVAEVNPNDEQCNDLCDVISLNRYYGWYSQIGEFDEAAEVLRDELEAWRKLGKPVLFTEFGADTVAGIHDATSVQFTEEYQTEYYQTYGKVFDSFDFVVGEQVWNFADFACYQSVYRVQGNKKGLFTRDRKPKMAAHYMRQRWMCIPDFNYKVRH